VNVVRLGGMVWNDPDSDVVLTLKDDAGNLIDFTGAANFGLVCTSLDGLDVFTVAGAIFGLATSGALRFAAVAGEAAEPAATVHRSYLCMPQWHASGQTDFSWARTQWSFWIQKFPA
jgi:hypothetical protein